MKALAIVGLYAMLGTLTTPAFATPIPGEDDVVPLDVYCQEYPSDCSHTGDTPNHQSSLSSTSEGGVFTCTAKGDEPCDDHSYGN
jgi:hypothetical protein